MHTGGFAQGRFAVAGLNLSNAFQGQEVDDLGPERCVIIGDKDNIGAGG